MFSVRDLCNGHVVVPIANAPILAAAMGGTYEFVKTASANLREREDPWNTAFGGFFSGAILGLRGQS